MILVRTTVVQVSPPKIDHARELFRMKTHKIVGKSTGISESLACRAPKRDSQKQIRNFSLFFLWFILKWHLFQAGKRKLNIGRSIIGRRQAEVHNNKLYTNLVLVIPENITGRFRTKSYGARQIYGAAFVNIQIRSA